MWEAGKHMCCRDKPGERAERGQARELSHRCVPCIEFHLVLVGQSFGNSFLSTFFQVPGSHSRHTSTEQTTAYIVTSHICLASHARVVAISMRKKQAQRGCVTCSKSTARKGLGRKQDVDCWLQRLWSSGKGRGPDARAGGPRAPASGI